MLTSIHAHVRQRRLLVILSLVVIGLFGALLVASAADGHLHIGGAAVLTLDETSVDRIINSLLVVIGVIAVPQALWRIARRILSAVGQSTQTRMSPRPSLASSAICPDSSCLAGIIAPVRMMSPGCSCTP